MSDTNIVIFTGNLGGDPEGKPTTEGGFVCNFDIAVSGYNQEEKPMWVRVAAWRELGKICHKNLKKGRKVLVTGRLEHDKKTGGPHVFAHRDKTAGASFEMTAATVQFLDAPARNTDEAASSKKNAEPDAEESSR